MRTALYILTILLTVGCGGEEHAQLEISADEYAVIDLIINRSVPSVPKFRDQKLNFYRQLPRFPPAGIKFDERYMSQHRARFDSAKAVLDTAGLYIVIAKEIQAFPANQLAMIRQAKRIQLIGSGYHNVIKVKMMAHLADTATAAATLDTNCIRSIKGYRHIYYSGRFDKSVKRFGPGTFTCSRVCFDRSKTSACIFYTCHCGFLCGAGKLLFLEKVKGTWQVFEEQELWTS